MKITAATPWLFGESVNYDNSYLPPVKLSSGLCPLVLRAGLLSKTSGLGFVLLKTPLSH